MTHILQNELDILFNKKDKYIIEKDLGNNVYSALNKTDNRIYVIKTISFNPQSDISNKTLLELGFIRALSIFPNSSSYINTCHDMAVGTNMIYTVYDILNGVTLGEFISRIYKSPNYISFTIQIIKHTLKTLAYTHKRGIAHRDICPDNMVVSYDTQKPYLINTIRLVNFEKSCGYFLNLATNKFDNKKCGKNMNRIITAVKDIIKVDADTMDLYMSKKDDIEKLGEILWSIINRSVFDRSSYQTFRGKHKTMERLHIFVVENMLKDVPRNANEILNKFILLDKYGWEYQ